MNCLVLFFILKNLFLTIILELKLNLSNWYFKHRKNKEEEEKKIKIREGTEFMNQIHMF